MITTIPSQTSEISTVDALWVLIQGQTKAVRKALIKRLLAEQDKTKVQKAMVKESLTRAFDELHAGKVHHVARKNDVSDNTAHIWDGYQLSAEVIAMAPGQRKSIYGDYKEEIAELLEEKYR